MKGLTEKEDYEFKIKLTSIYTLSIYEKKGFLTLCLILKGLNKRRVFLRKAEGLRDWFNLIKLHVDEAQRRKSNFMLYPKMDRNQFYIEGATESEVDDGKEYIESDVEDYETDSLNDLTNETESCHARFIRSSMASDILADTVVDSFDDSLDEKNEDSGVESGSNTDSSENRKQLKNQKTCFEKIRSKISPDEDLIICHV